MKVNIIYKQSIFTKVHLIFFIIFSFSVGSMVFLTTFIICIGAQAKRTMIATLCTNLRSMAATSITSLSKMIDRI